MVDHRKLTGAENKQLVSRCRNIKQSYKGRRSYLDAYELKFGWETELKHYDSVIVAGRKILKLGAYDQAQTIYRVGECYELTGEN